MASSRSTAVEVCAWVKESGPPRLDRNERLSIRTWPGWPPISVRWPLMAYAASAPDSTSADGSGPAAENGPARSSPGTSPETDGRSDPAAQPVPGHPVRRSRPRPGEVVHAAYGPLAVRSLVGQDRALRPRSASWSPVPLRPATVDHVVLHQGCQRWAQPADPAPERPGDRTRQQLADRRPRIGADHAPPAASGSPATPTTRPSINRQLVDRGVQPHLDLPQRQPGGEQLDQNREPARLVRPSPPASGRTSGPATGRRPRAPGVCSGTDPCR